MVLQVRIGLVVLAATFGFSSSAQVLFDAATVPLDSVAVQDGAAFVRTNGALMVTTPAGGRPGIVLSGDWDLADCGALEIELINGGWKNLTVGLVEAGGDLQERRGCYTARPTVRGPNPQRTVVEILPTLANWESVLVRLKGLRLWAFPYLLWPGRFENVACWTADRSSGVHALTPGRAIREIVVYLDAPSRAQKWGIRRIVATGRRKSADEVPAFARSAPDAFFPFIDRYGQFAHRDWPDKIHTDADFAERKAREERDLAAHPGPSDWDKWGGWLKGPQLKATGCFRVEKIDGKWWMVDPDGRLWWSHGPVRVTPSSAITPLDNRDDWFAELPSADSPFAVFYTTRDELLHPYYVARNIKRTYDFSAANIRRKYGADWFDAYARLAHRRLRSWGCNTIANSSDLRICRLHKTPYVDRFELKSRPIAGSDASAWWPFRDPFDPSFREEVRRQMALHKEEMEDVWCVGFFVDNELCWGEPHSLALWSLQSPADQPAKIAFVRRLTEKYGTIARLNAAWRTAYASWEALLTDTRGPSVDPARADLEAFSAEIADAYYRNIRDEFKKAAPDKLYFGCRYAGLASAKPFNLRAAAKYCDALSFNIYAKDLSSLVLPEGVDKPVMIGEFHFGALDRGPFCPGLILLNDQEERAAAYRRYVESALRHPLVIGVHWHQFSDQATSGRFDGENMQVGWTDCCDTPYWETIEAVRAIGDNLYSIRLRSDAGHDKNQGKD